MPRLPPHTRRNDMYNNQNTAFIEDLKSKISNALDPIVDPSKRFALVDFPNYSNVGDSAIWLGEIAYFENHLGRRPDYVCSGVETFEESVFLAHVPEGNTIFINGGGNFGDLWPAPQSFREMLLDQYKNHKIVQLPQSIHFQHEENIEKSQKVINAHPDFTLLVRDHKSYDFAKKHYTCHVELVPDMAFFLGPLRRRTQPIVDIYFLKRSDKEQVSLGEGENPFAQLEIKIEDWLDEDADLVKKHKYKVLLTLPYLMLRDGVNPTDKNACRYALYKSLASDRLERGLKALSSGQYLLTDRLHATILAVLMNMPVVRLDNSYGKIDGFFSTWDTKHGASMKASSINEAVAHLKTLK